MTFETEIAGDGELINRAGTQSGFFAVYEKEPRAPFLRLRQRAETEEQDVLAFAFQAAVTKARELGWIA